MVAGYPASVAVPPSTVQVVGVRPRGTVVLAAYNERAGLPLVLDALEAVTEAELDIIVVDDGSTDGTHEMATRPSTKLIRHARNRGKGAAILSGVDAATTDVIVCIDADNTYPVGAIPDMIRCLERCDLVLATRSTGRENIPAINRFGNWAFGAVMQGVTRRRLADPLTGLYAMRADDVRRMGIRSRGFGIEAEIAIKSAALRLATCEHPIAYAPRAGASQVTAGS